jgi:hypothetical protein
MDGPPIEVAFDPFDLRLTQVRLDGGDSVQSYIILNRKNVVDCPIVTLGPSASAPVSLRKATPNDAAEKVERHSSGMALPRVFRVDFERTRPEIT